MKKVLLSLTALSMLAFASCGGDEKEGDEDKKKGEDKKEVVEEKEEIEVIKLSVELDESYVWFRSYAKDTSLNKSHYGKLRMSDAEIELTNGELTGGFAEFDITSLYDSDLEAGSKGLTNLIGHLSAADFFNLAEAGAPRFEVTGYADGVISGNMTMNGRTNAIEVPAKVSVSDDVVAVTSDKFDLDMTQFGVEYFAQEKEEEEALILNPSIELEINLHGHK